MHLRYRFVLPLVALCMAITVATSFAAKPVPTLVSSQPDVHQSSSVNAFPPACAMGLLPPPAVAFGYILPPDDEYFTLLNPANCPTCPNNSYHYTMAHVILYFTEPCQIPVTVSIMPAFLTAPGCYTPNPFAPPLCPPVTYSVNDGGNLNACLDFALPLAAGCCFDGPVFLKIQFDQGSCVAGRPAFCGPATCSNCQQYNFYPGAAFPGDDLCALLGPQGIGGANMWVDADCCLPTPTLPGSWGKVKTLYR